ncbi:DNA-directed RNA polymerase III subunit RPC4-like [Branchiostoma floridae]|uniref:DNA-directed RNA polymerase III subunit RPC4-like n=1 Tax=Branchiostoma floridae TaxID=7739 RepID=A0A9J7KU01_BRAFL|nr:DNA-directed RNA polymerase III subunit RPC4-like [Branchiostoma floridae]XP_035669960.1 DNA-directed RNA polymerase III subunit RPC4-like [Branchiostoma floridae]
MASNKDGAGRPTPGASGTSGNATPSSPLVARRGRGAPRRLPSIRSPRDLTLGGVPKKTFTPNIPVRKERNKNGESSTSKPEQKGKSSKRGEERGRGRGGRGRGRGRGDVIRTHSIFEDGPAGRQVRRGGGGGGGSYGPSDMPAPVFKAGSRTDIPENKEDTKKILKALQRDDFVSDMGYKETEKSLLPVQVPLVTTGSLIKHKEEEEMETDVKTNINVKSEPVDDVEMEDLTEPSVSTAPVKAAPSRVKSEVGRGKRVTCSELFCSKAGNDGEMLFFQLPDTLPILPPSRDDDVRREVKKEEEKIKQEKEEDKAEVASVLPNMSEGYIGKLQVLKSGRTRLVLGDVALDVNMGSHCSFHQELVSVRHNAEEQTGDMTILGPVNHRLVCTPDFNSLLKLS